MADRLDYLGCAVPKARLSWHRRVWPGLLVGSGTALVSLAGIDFPALNAAGIAIWCIGLCLWLPAFCTNYACAHRKGLRREAFWSSVAFSMAGFWATPAIGWAGLHLFLELGWLTT